MKKLYVLLILIHFHQFASSQCPVFAKANVTSVQCGDTVKLQGLGSAGDYLIDVDFNTPAKQPGPDWTTAPSASYSNPCGAGPDGTICMWMGNTADVPRDLTSKAFDLRTGGYIKFDMRYARQGDNSPCEGVDLPEEGVYLQYNVAGAGWNTIDYFPPNGGTDPVMTNWKTYQYTIPLNACKQNTQIRWIQLSSSGIDTDHWGLDNIQIVRNDPNFLFDWLHDPATPNSTGYTPPVMPYSDTTYTVVLSNGQGSSCTASVHITVAKPTGTVQAIPDKVCINGNSQLGVVASLIPPVPTSCGLSPTGCQGNSSTITVGSGTTSETTFMPLGRTINNGSCTCSNLNGNKVATCDNSSRTQMIIQSSEFPSFFRGGQVYNLALFPFALQANGAAVGSYNNFTIKMGCTNKTEFGSNTDFQGGLVTVFAPHNVSMSNNTWKTFEFDQAFDWDGLSNVVIEISWFAAGNTFNGGNVNKTATTFYSTINSYSCDKIGSTETQNAKRFQLRPSLKLGICYRLTPSISYTWSPSAGLSNPRVSNPIATVSATTQYTITVADAGKPKCNFVKSVTITAADPSLSVTPDNATVCTGSTSVVLSGSASPSVSGGAITSWSWTPATGLSNSNSSTVTASPSATTTYIVKVTDNNGCTATTEVLIGYCASVPIELSAFKATKTANIVKLEWTTLSEHNSDYFLLERAQDAIHYKPIGTIKANNNRSQETDYVFFDEKPFNSSNYYRLRIVDKDGYWAYSKIEFIALEASGTSFQLANLSPVPAEDNLSFSLISTKDDVIEVKILSLTGQVLKSESRQVTAGNNELKTDIVSLSKGIYLLQTVSKEGNCTKRFIK